MGHGSFSGAIHRKGYLHTFLTPNSRISNGATSKFPSNWEMQGYGDKLFRNVSAPFGVNPPHAPKEYNPTGLYRRTFKVPASWAAKDQIFLRFEKVASASFVWVNGHEVGYNEGAQEPAEYNITPYLKPGESAGCLSTEFQTVITWKDKIIGNWPESLTTYGCTPHLLFRIFDWQVITEFDNTYTDSQLSIRVKVKNYQKKPNENYGLKAYLKDKNGKIICNFSAAPFEMDAAKRQYSCIPRCKNTEMDSRDTRALYARSGIIQSGRSAERQDRNGHRIQKDGNQRRCFLS